MENLFVFIDTETSGLNPSLHKLLSIGLIVWSKNNRIIDKREYFIKYKKYNLTDESQRITNFNLNEHEKRAISGKKVICEILTFLNKYFHNTKITLIGHNIGFDIGFLKKFFYLYNIDYSSIFSHRSIDTYSIYKSLIISNKINASFDSLSDALKYFNIESNNRHTAIGDCLMTVKLFEKLLDIIGK